MCNWSFFVKQMYTTPQYLTIIMGKAALKKIFPQFPTEVMLSVKCKLPQSTTELFQCKQQINSQQGWAEELVSKTSVTLSLLTVVVLNFINAFITI